MISRQSERASDSVERAEAGDRPYPAAVDSVSAGRVRRRKFADLVACVLLAAAALGFSAWNVSGHKTISPYDEYVYIDYYAKVLDHGIVREGEKTGDFARRYMSCHPNRQFGPWQPQLCGAHRPRPDAAYPFAGATTAGLYTPLFFLSIRAAAQPLVWAGVDLVQAGRFACGMWLAFGVVLLFLAIRRMRVPLTVAVGASLCAIGSTAAYWANTYISTDAAAIAAGAGMLWLALRFLEVPTARRGAALVTASVVFALIKLQNIEATLVVAMALLLLTGRDAIGAHTSSARRVRAVVSDRRAVVAVLALLAGLVAQAAWLLGRSVLAVGADPDMGVGSPVKASSIVTDMFSFLPGISRAGPDLGPWGSPSMNVLTLVIVGGVIGVLFGSAVGAKPKALAGAVVFTSLVSGPGLSLSTLVMTHEYVGVAIRYGLPILPGMLACAALLVPAQSRGARTVALAVGLLVFAMSFGFQR